MDFAEKMTSPSSGHHCFSLSSSTKRFFKSLPLVLLIVLLIHPHLHVHDHRVEGKLLDNVIVNKLFKRYMAGFGLGIFVKRFNEKYAPF